METAPTGKKPGLKEHADTLVGIAYRAVAEAEDPSEAQVFAISLECFMAELLAELAALREAADRAAPPAAAG